MCDWNYGGKCSYGSNLLWLACDRNAKHGSLKLGEDEKGAASLMKSAPEDALAFTDLQGLADPFAKIGSQIGRLFGQDNSGSSLRSAIVL